MKYFLSVDLGGTKTAVALFTQNGKLVDDFVYFKSKSFIHSGSSESH